MFLSQELWSRHDVHQLRREHFPSPEERVYDGGRQALGQGHLQEQEGRQAEGLTGNTAGGHCYYGRI